MSKKITFTGVRGRRWLSSGAFPSDVCGFRLGPLAIGRRRTTPTYVAFLVSRAPKDNEAGRGGFLAKLMKLITRPVHRSIEHGEARGKQKAKPRRAWQLQRGLQTLIL